MKVYDEKLSSEYSKNRGSLNVDTDKVIFKYIESFGGVVEKEILDLGCGDGRYSIKFHDLGASKVVGIDISPSMISLAKQREVSGVEFMEGDAASLPFLDNSFDLIFSNFVLQHIKDIKKVLQEIKRVLKNEGVFVAMLNTFNIKPGAENLSYTEIPLNLIGDTGIVQVIDLIIPDKDLKENISNLNFSILLYEYQPNPQAVIDSEYSYENKVEKMAPLVIIRKN